MREVLQEVIDQFGHFITAIVIFFPIVRWRNIYGFILSGFILGYLREVEQHRSFTLNFWSWLDVVFWIVGSITLWMIYKYYIEKK